ncbi:MAG TPA: hypothetical protein VH277_01470 [Gemmatimonadaceae bacterium]|jgi:sugar lactone lactonase YvrE|nr:hypothetical protein [Gemmatimonadaceae bacterium]
MAKLELVAEFEHQVTGVTVSEDGRIFVNFPRWTEDTALSVAELMPDGSLRPYPNAEWNAWRNAKMARVTPEDWDASDDEITQSVEALGTYDVTDGFWFDARDRLYLSALEENAVKRLEGGRVTTIVKDDRLRWPDTFSEGPDGSIYVTASHIMDMPWYEPGNPKEVRSELFRIVDNG